MSTTCTTSHNRLGQIRVLHVDDEREVANTAATFIQHEDDRFIVETASGASDGLDRLADKQFDCVVSDYDMPGQDGIDFLKAVRETHPDLPFVLFTGKGSEEIASEAISAGVSDYFRKGSGTDRYSLLANRIENLVAQHRAEAQLETRAEQGERIDELRQNALAGASPEALFEQAVTMVTETLGTKYAKVLEHRPEHDDLLLRAGTGWQEGLVGEATVGTGEDSQAGHTLRSEEPMVVEELGSEDRFRGPPLLVEHDVVSGISVIIGPADDPWGVLGTHTTERTAFTDDDITFIQNVANVLANAIERNEREQEIRRTNTLLSTLFDALPQGVLAEDESRSVLIANQQLFGLFELPGAPEEVVGADCEKMGETISDTFEQPDRFVERINSILAEREPVDGEELALADGRIFERIYRPIELPDGDGNLWMYREITDRKHRERELEAVQRRFDAVLENTTTPMFMKDDEGRYIFVNQAYCDLFDLRDEEIVGRTDYEIHPPEMAAEVQKNDQAVIERGEPIETEERIDIHSEERTFLSTKVPIYDTGERSNPDTPVATFGVATDITDRKETEEQLREEQQFVQSIFQSLPDPFYTFDTDGRPIRWNEEFEDVSGYSSTEIEGMSITDFVPDEETEFVADNFRIALKEERSVTFESTVETKDGTRIPYEFTGGPLEAADGTVRGVTGVGRDITEQTVHEQQLEALNRIAQELMSAKTRDEVVEIGVETARDLLGLDANAIHLYDEDIGGLAPAAVTDAAYDLIGEPPTFTGPGSIAWRVYQQGKPLAVDDVHDDPDIHNPDTPVQSELYLPIGEYGILIATSASPETFDERDMLLAGILTSGLAAALEQVGQTEQLRARERELIKQNERLEQFASIVSHDLRNPLNVATGRLELAATECDSEHIEHVERAHERMRALIEDILSLARERKTVTDTGSVALAPLVKGCWANVETGEATLVTDIQQTVQADEGRLKQLFENLIRNCVEHGSTSSRTESDDAVEHGGEDVTVTVGELADGFYIEDDGPGIPVEEREAVFDAGYSTSEGGTGFGLSIVKGIVDAHGWRIHVTDGTDGGARFEITDVAISKP